MKGKIKKIMEKGFGFIAPADGNKDIFFHCSALKGSATWDDLREGLPVDYDVEQGEKGPKAINVKVI